MHYDKTKTIYLDYAATTPIDPDILVHMMPYFGSEYGNASSMYTSGRKAKQVINAARADVAEIIGANSEEIIFTGSGTEADNLAILGTCEAYMHKGNHIIISAIEHKAVTEAAQLLTKKGFEVSVAPVDSLGRIMIPQLLQLITDKTILVSVMYANNEIGTIQPIGELVTSVRKYRGGSQFPLVHTDACQAPGFLPLNVVDLDIDLMTLNSSKIYGPKGVGMLYKKKKVNIVPQIVGGDQEHLMRAGTENIALIAGFAHALKKVVKDGGHESVRLQKLQRWFMLELKSKIPQLQFNGHAIHRLPNNIHLSIPAVEGESMLLMLDQYGIEASTGSACSALDLRPSHVLTAIGQHPDIIHGSIRFSLGKYTTKEELETVLKIFPSIVKTLTGISSTHLCHTNAAIPAKT